METAVPVVLVLVLLLTTVGGAEVSLEVEGLQQQGAPYVFQYGVSAPQHGTRFGHQERQDGLGNRRGRYWVALPDGRLQTVEYRVEGQGGFRAEVSYQGQASHPPGLETNIAAQALVAQVHHAQHQDLSQQGEEEGSGGSSSPSSGSNIPDIVNTLSSSTPLPPASPPPPPTKLPPTPPPPSPVTPPPPPAPPSSVPPPLSAAPSARPSLPVSGLFPVPRQRVPGGPSDSLPPRLGLPGVSRTKGGLRFRLNGGGGRFGSFRNNLIQQRIITIPTQFRGSPSNIRESFLSGPPPAPRFHSRPLPIEGSVARAGFKGL